jgi:hypothetical protein
LETTILEEKDMTDAQLCDRFDRDILYDVHSLRAKVGRSKAGKQLLAKGRDVLITIAKHLEEHTQLHEFELGKGWGMLLHDISIRADPQMTTPLEAGNIPGWIAWARRIASPPQ